MLQTPNWEKSLQFADDLDPSPSLDVFEDGSSVRMPFAEWIQRTLRLPENAPVNGGGLLSFADAPYQRDIYASMDDEDVDEIILVCSNQLGKTQFILSTIAWAVDRLTTSIVVAPDVTLISSLRSRFDALVRTNPDLQDKLPKVYARDGSKNNERELTFRHGEGSIYWGSTTSKGSITSVSAQVVILDEVPKMTTTYADGDSIISYLKKRQGAFIRSKQTKTIACGSPTFVDEELWQRFLTTSQNKYHCPCPNCGAFQEYDWDNVRYEVTPSGTTYNEYIRCVECEHQITEEERIQSLQDGQWIADVPEEIRRLGFNIGKLSSTFSTLHDVCQEYEVLNKTKTPNALAGFYNGTLAKPYVEKVPEEHGVSPGHLKEHNLVEIPSDQNMMPDEVDYLTAGVDVQADRLVCVVGGYGIDSGNFYILNHHEIGGPTNVAPRDANSVWQSLLGFLSSNVYGTGENRRRPIVCVVDSGYLPKNVYEFCHGRQSRYEYYDYEENLCQMFPLISSAKILLDIGGEYFTVDQTPQKRQVGKQMMRLVKAAHTNPHVATHDFYARLRVTDEDKTHKIFINKEIATSSLLEDICSQRWMENKKVLGYEYVSVTSSTPNHVLDASKYALAAAEWALRYVRLEREGRSATGEKIKEHAEKLEERESLVFDTPMDEIPIFGDFEEMDLGHTVLEFEEVY